MGLHIHGGTMSGALTPICNSCGVSLCWDVSVEDGRCDQDFWDQWTCQDCNNGVRMSLERWRFDHPKSGQAKIGTKVTVIRNAGHPWDKRPGFDLLFLDTKSQAEMAIAVKKANSRYWHNWLIGFTEGTELPGGVLYKPSGICEEWVDEVDNPHPGRLQAHA